MDNFFMLTSEDEEIKLSLHFQGVEIGKIGIINLLSGEECLGKEAEILLTDDQGENVYEAITNFPFTFILPKEFNMNGKILVDIFSGGQAKVSGIINSKSDKNAFVSSPINAANNNEYYNYNDNIYNVDSSLMEEARYYSWKAKQLYGETKETNNNACRESTLDQSNKKQSLEPTFYDKIKNDFNLLFGVGTEDYLLTRKFKGSKWRKLEIDGETIILGKFFSGEEDQTPSRVAIAIPAVNARVSGEDLMLGSEARFYEASIYDEFGFWVLIQNAANGKAVKI